jgi:hypothetical protein
MVAVSHIYITAHGEYHGSSPWVGEFAQIGLRLAYVDVTAEPAKGSVFTIMPNGDAVADSGTTAGANGSLTRAWTARIGPTGSTENMDAGEQIALAEDMRTFLAAVAPYQAASFRWTHIKLAPAATDGKYYQPAGVYVLTTPVVGSASGTYGITLPPEVSIAASLRAPIVGRRGRGRMYIPGLASLAMNSDGLVASATQTGIATALNTLVDNLDNRGGTPDYDGCVIVTSVGSSTAVRPSQARVGNHADVQRRRQSQVNESYVTQTI